jgi:hypothetical protein
MVWERITYDQAVAAGRNPATISNSNCYASQNPPGRYKCDLWPDKIVELDPSADPGDEVVWTWRAWEHKVQDFDNSKPNYFASVSDHPELIDINYRFPITYLSHRASADFMHANRVDFQADPSNPNEGRVILNSRVFGEFFVINYPSGEIIDRWGNPCATKTGDCPSYMNNGSQQLFGAHASHFIKPGYPGEGNVLIWDNGWMRPASISQPGGFPGILSRTLEVNIDRAGRTPRTTSPADIAWQFMPFSSMYSAFVGDTRRLINGNTLVSSSLQGHFIEVTSEGDIAWEFVVPLYGGPEALCIAENEDSFGNFTGVVRRYAKDFSGFGGRKFNKKKPFNRECPVGPYVADPFGDID